MRWTFATKRGDLVVEVDGEEEFEALRQALNDPVWLLGADWDVVSTNEFKRGRFEDAFGAWTKPRDGREIAEHLRSVGLRARMLAG